jgi:hypothetical protein
MLSKNAMSFSEMLKALEVSSSFLTYHLENLGELILKTDDGKYRLSSFGEAAIATMTKVEDIPATVLQQSTQNPVDRPRARKMGIATLVIGLIIGLVSGAFIGAIFLSSTMRGVGVNDQVQVSGTVNETQQGTIQFINWNETISTRYAHYVQITGGEYSILLVSGQSYDVYIGTGETGYSYEYSLYVPSNITTLTANF